MQRFTGPLCHRSAGRKAINLAIEADHHGVQCRLHLRLCHVRINGAAGDALSAVRQTQGECHLNGRAGNNDALRFAASGLTLCNVARLDDCQSEVGKVAGNVGHVHMGQCVLECHQEGGSPTLRVGAINAHRHVARPDGAQAFERALDVGGQCCVVAAVSNGRAVHATQRDLEVAGGHLRVDLKRCQLELGHVDARQSAAEADRVGIDCAAHHDRAQA